MSKNYVLMRDIISKYHPEFRDSKNTSLQKYALKNPDIFNCERLIEETLAAVGGYNFVNETGRDFDCPYNSDSKTTSLGCGSGFQILGVENKIGSLRITVYNPYKDRLDFLYMPYSSVQFYKEVSYGKNQFKERVRGKWNQNNDHYNRLERFRVHTFEDLARASG